MSVFVLVHGGFFGGWGFTQTANLLRAAGNDIFTPTMTGWGERAHLARPDVGLHTNIQDIVGVLQCEDLHGVILVGHSYGSVVVHGVAEKEPERIARLAVLDGFIPKNGESVFDVIGTELREQWLQYAKEKGEGWRTPGLPNAKPPRWQPGVLRMMMEPLELVNPIAAKIPRAFIRCTVRVQGGAVASGADRIDRIYAQEAKTNGWWYREIPDGHAVMLTNPKLLADTLLELA